MHERNERAERKTLSDRAKKRREGGGGGGSRRRRDELKDCP